MRISSRLVSAGRHSTGLLALAVGLGLLGGIITVVLSYQVSSIVNSAFLDSSSPTQLLPLFLSCLGLMVLRAGFTWAAEFSARKGAIRIKQTLRERLITHLFMIGPTVISETDDEHGHTGELVNTTLHSVEALETFFSQYLPQLALSALVPLTILFFLYPLDPLTALILTLTAPLLPVFMYLIGSAAKAQTQHQWLSLGRMSAYLLEVLQGLTTLKALGRSREQAETIDKVSESHRRITMSILRVTFLSALALEMVATLSTAVVAVEIGLRLLYGQLLFQQAFFILLLAPEFYLPLRILGLRFHPAMSGIEAARRIFEILDIPPKGIPININSNTQAHLPLPLTPPNIQFKNVSFTYPDGRRGLVDASFEIPTNKITMLAGESGSGKSTVISLLLRFLKPQEGNILIDDIPLNEISPTAWTNRLAWVPQHPYLFQDSLAANISLGRPDASLPEIQNASRLAHADEFIQTLPDKYETQIGERGVTLSAGQAQRIALARAFLQDAPLLLLDEPGSHLDPHTDALILDSLATLVQGRTTIVVSHQPHPLLPPDQTIWLNQGQIEGIEQYAQQLDDQQIPHLEFDQSYTHASPSQLPVSVTFEKPTQTPVRNNLLRLLHFLSPFSGRVAFSVLLGFFTVASSMGLMSMAAYLISRAALHHSISDLQVTIVSVRFFGLSRGVFRYLERLVTHDVTFRLLGKLRGWFFRSVEPIVPARTRYKHSGDLLHRAIGDIATLEDFYVRSIAPPIIACLIGLSVCLLLAKYNLLASIYLIVILIVSGVVLPIFILVLNRQPGHELVTRLSSFSQSLVDIIQGMPDLLASGQSERYINSTRRAADFLAKTQIRMAIRNSLQSSASRFMADAGMLGVLFLGARQVSIGQMDGVILGALSLLVLSCFEAITPLSGAALHLSSNLSAANRLFEIADLPPEVKNPLEPVPAPEKFDLRVKNLSFCYRDQETYPGQEVLSRISFSLTPGRKVALVGPSGAGKTSLLNLLLRFWESPEGTILLNGNYLNCYSGDALRKKMAVLTQNPSLFSATIWDNIRLINPQAEIAEVEQAAKNAFIHDWILTLPDRYQTWCGESGIRLSGGQRQRIALARTLLRQSPLFILDEPYLHLDPGTVQEVLRGILKTVEKNSASLILITHHLIGMEWMDEIMVLHKGRIIERGNHHELMSRRGLYYGMEIRSKGNRPINPARYSR